MGDQLTLDTGPSPYATFEGKTYLKAVIVAQANSALGRGERFVLPPGVIFEAVNSDWPWRSVKPLPFKGRFLAEPAEARDDQSRLHALAHVVREIVEVPDDCPPVGRWERADGV